MDPAKTAIVAAIVKRVEALISRLYALRTSLSPLRPPAILIKLKVFTSFNFDKLLKKLVRDIKKPPLTRLLITSSTDLPSAHLTTPSLNLVKKAPNHSPLFCRAGPPIDEKNSLMLLKALFILPQIEENFDPAFSIFLFEMASAIDVNILLMKMPIDAKAGAINERNCFIALRIFLNPTQKFCRGVNFPGRVSVLTSLIWLKMFLKKLTTLLKVPLKS